MKTQNLVRALVVAFGLFALAAPSYAHWDVGITVGFAPPPLPVYVQPPCPGMGYIWTPGYWAFDNDEDGYYWVPGTWVFAPRPGLLWTPGYWGVDGAYFAWHPGYWGPTVGFYGGINYGFGYFGIGFSGGYWRDHDFFYNRAVTNITNVSITNVYSNAVVNNQVTHSRVSYNGGPAGTHARPSGAELAAAHAPHFMPTDDQLRHVEAARAVPALHYASNHGVPAVTATPRAAMFSGHGLPATRAVGDAAANRAAGRGFGEPASPRSSFTSPRQATAASPSDRPAGTQAGPRYGAMRPDAAPARGAAGPARDFQYRPVPRPGYAPAARPETAATPRREAGARAAYEPRGYSGPAARPSAPRPAAGYAYAPREPQRPAYVQHATQPPRDYGRAPSSGAARPAPGPARSYSAPRGGNQTAHDNHGGR